MITPSTAPHTPIHDDHDRHWLALDALVVVSLGIATATALALIIAQVCS